MTLVEFLRARLDEDEAVARSALARVSRWPKDQSPPWALARLKVDQLGKRTAALDAFEGRETPDEVLAEVAARRAIVEHCTSTIAAAGEPPGIEPDDIPATAHVLRLLALPHASHPDYRQEWAP